MESTEMKETCDLAVIGGGPAGSSAAITAARLGFTVLLLEAGSFPRQKVCGEFVSGEALSILAELVGEKQFAHAPRIGKARIFVRDARANLPVSPPAASISRYDLDAALYQASALGGCVVRDRTRVQSAVSSQNGFMIRLESVEIFARAAINATGRWSNLAKRTASPHERFIGLKGHFFEPACSKSCDLYFFDGGYCGVQPISDGMVNAAAMVKPSVAKNLTSVFALNRDLKERSRRWKAAGDSISTAPLIFRAPMTSHDGMLLVGDAAAFLDPFAGDGISIALHSGRIAAGALGRFLVGRCTLADAIAHYDQEYRRLIHPALNGAKRLRTLQSLPLGLRAAAVACLNIPFLARTVIKTTRMSAASLRTA
jgi:flavin-dependent dehydrogenase